jgi:2-polyprenyl-3-methyl-5-hydroxy-6-metoxy-1,4-benzoquinol methylase
MASLTPEEEAVARLYDERLYEYELDRLDVHWVEFGMTLRALERWAGPPNRAEHRRVAIDVGVGSGAYSGWLAARGFDVHLVDVSEKLLAAAQARVERERRADRVVGLHHASATRVTAISDATADLLLEMGPLYHLQEPSARRECVREAFRLLKPGGLIFASGVNRLAYLSFLVKEHPDQGATRRDHLLRFLREGNIDDFGKGQSLIPATEREAYGHLTTASELSAELGRGFDQVALLGLESFVGDQDAELPVVAQVDRDAWLDVVEATAQSSEALGCSSHFLYVGTRKENWTD